MANFNAHNYLRVALVPVTAKGQCIDVDDAAFKSNVYAADDTAYNPIKADGSYSTATADKITPIVAGSPEVINIPDPCPQVRNFTTTFMYGSKVRIPIVRMQMLAQVFQTSSSL